MKNEQEIQVLGIFVHGFLTAFHGLGIFYNLYRKNWGNALIHSVVVGYDLWAVSQHLGAIKKEDND